MTTIHIDEETWKKLNEIKELGESMNDVVKRLLNMKGFEDEADQDDREFDLVLDDFIDLQHDIDSVLEGSRESFSKVKG
ncbi:MAG: DUF7557 family protein [Candidatus Kariarchaeaceae archaeon]|jgi:negative regulator of replication initiation